MYLVDTNIFLEILLHQENSKECKLFLDNNIVALHISDFSLHSIGVILFRNKKREYFLKIYFGYIVQYKPSLSTQR